MSHDHDPERAALRATLATIEGSYTAHGYAMTVKVSPCSWMYQGYGLQVEYTAADGRFHGFLNDKPRKVEDTTRADVQRLLDGLLAPVKCSRCETGYLLGEDSKKYRGTLCEPCWMDDFKKRCDADAEKERRRVARQDARMVKKGYTHRISAWVHPAGGGDDYLVDFYCKGEPTKEDVAKLLRKNGSRVLDDYGVEALAK